jgi:hypothetical protein
VDEKSHFFPTPCAALWGAGGKLYGPEDLLNKNVSYTEIIIKSMLKITFLMKTSETKKLAEIFCEEFFIFNTFSVSFMQDSSL